MTERVTGPPSDLIPAPLDLVGIDGNAGAVIGAVARALRRAGNPPHIVDAFRLEATKGNYDHLLQIAMAYTCDPEDNDR